MERHFGGMGPDDCRRQNPYDTGAVFWSELVGSGGPLGSVRRSISVPHCGAAGSVFLATRFVEAGARPGKEQLSRLWRTLMVSVVVDVDIAG